MTTATTQDRASYIYLRSVCQSLQERLVLGEAIRNGWPADAIEAEASAIKGRMSKKNRKRHAIHAAASRIHYSSEEQAANQAAAREHQAALEARDAMKATRSNRPAYPADYKQISTACRSLLDCDRLTAVIEQGWTAAQLNCLARQFSERASLIPNKETPAAFRWALEFIGGAKPQDFPRWLPEHLMPSGSQQEKQ